MQCFTAALDADNNSDQQVLNAKGAKLNAMTSYMVHLDFASATVEFKTIGTRLNQLAGQLDAAAAALQQAVENAKTAVNIARFADDVLVVAAGIARQMH
jgi:hypothetical protein